jgi:predicted small secreted protein
MKKHWLVLAIGLILITLTACETMKGVGRDMEDAGEWVQEKAN